MNIQCKKILDFNSLKKDYDTIDYTFNTNHVMEYDSAGNGDTVFITLINGHQVHLKIDFKSLMSQIDAK